MTAATGHLDPARDLGTGAMHADTDHGRVVVELWTDLGCPWCYLGKHRLQAAVSTRPAADRITVRLRCFELDPHAAGEPADLIDVLVRKHGVEAAQAQRMERRLQQLAAGEGLPFSTERLHGNSFDVHRVLKLAEDHGLGWQYFSLVQDRYFAGELNPFDRPRLIGAAADAGLPAAEVGDVLDGDRYTGEVRADEAEARGLGVTAVPFVVVDRRLATVGARTVQEYAQLLDRVAA